jgi:hydrogenase maturation protease
LDKPTVDGGESRSEWRALVIGLGNPLRGDDGLGPAVIEALRPHAGPGLKLIESAGQDLVEWLGSEEFDRIVVVDAADLGRGPGSWTRLTPARLAAASTGELTHGMGLVPSLELLSALGVRPAPISIYAVQPASAGWRPGLSREASRAVQAVAAAIRQELCLPELPRRPERGKDGAPDNKGSPLVALRRQERVREERKETHG